MNMHEIPELDKQGLRQFGLVTGGMVAGLFGLFFPWLLALSYPLWPWLIAGVLGVWALMAPNSLAPVYRIWMRIGLILGAISSRIVLSILFYLLITPVGFAMRWFGRDPMARQLDEQAKSYRVASHRRSNDHLEKPF